MANAAIRAGKGCLVAESNPDQTCRTTRWSREVGRLVTACYHHPGFGQRPAASGAIPTHLEWGWQKASFFQCGAGRAELRVCLVQFGHCAMQYEVAVRMSHR